MAYTQAGWFSIPESVLSSCLRTLRLREVKWPAQGCIPRKRQSQPGLQASGFMLCLLCSAPSCVQGAMGIAFLGNKVHREEDNCVNNLFWKVCLATKQNVCSRVLIALRLLWRTYQYLWKVQRTVVPAFLHSNFWSWLQTQKCEGRENLFSGVTIDLD